MYLKNSHLSQSVQVVFVHGRHSPFSLARDLQKPFWKAASSLGSCICHLRVLLVVFQGLS